MKQNKSKKKDNEIVHVECVGNTPGLSHRKLNEFNNEKQAFGKNNRYIKSVYRIVQIFVQDLQI
jgi:hypothetical protein